MSDDATPRLGLPYLAAGQAQKHVILNESLARLDGLVQTAVVSRSLAEQPSEPEDGDLYILADDPSGAAWGSLQPGDLVRFEAGAWSWLTANPGHVAWVADEAGLVVRTAEGWTLVGGTPDLQNLEGVGIGAASDPGNPLVVRGDAVLMTARPAADGGAGDMRLKLNKDTDEDTASLLFQTGWSGRAEMGLAGDDGFAIKVSADGGTWREALSVDPATGKVDFPLGALRPTETTIFAADGTYAPPAWARRLRMVCIGGGGGGGSGCSGTNAANRAGGGGGGAGGRSSEELDVAELSGGDLTIVVGAGGAGAAGATAGNGSTGGVGGDTTIADGAQVLLAAYGGGGGGGGSNVSGTAGVGGTGDSGANTGGAGSTAGTPTAGLDSIRGDGPGGGGGAGGLNTGGTATTGKDGGHGYVTGFAAGRRATRGSGGVSGASGTAGADKAWLRGCGAGGGGGGGQAGANGGSGGAGGAPGGGGGGGGACRETYLSGAGGDGGRGEVWIIAIG